MSLVSEVSPELFELRSFLFDGMKTRQNPSPQTTGKRTMFDSLPQAYKRTQQG
jgi:hypothetical protein